ncbi:MAG TPA: CaiB/BaiF CoA-transferase family protein [Rhodoblastus sp.]|mgnify:CR=1 FL=1|nr:CaiB/BaiF CoA-transferase family protein [Rhodoblastus sp.]
MTAALSGITIVDMTQGVSGPFATRLLAQLGARVIKIERPGGGDIVRFWDDIVHGMCSGHAWVNPGKESIALDLGAERGREILFDLAAKADVVIENFVPGTLEKWGITYQHLSKRNPGLIFCRISGFGQDGPYRDRSALDLIIQGEAGLIMTNGAPEEPAKISLSVCDISGSMYSAISILTALFHRQATGKGQKIEVALLDAVMTWTGYFPYMYWYRNSVPARVGLHHHTMTPYGPYAASDGRMVIVAAGSGHRALWEKFCLAIERPDIVDHPDYATNALRLEHRAQLDEIVSVAIGARDRDYWLARFHEFGIPSGALNDLADALNHPRLKSRNLVREVDSVVGSVKVFDFPAEFSESQSVNRLGPPALGQHTRSILTELGIDDAEISRLEADKIVEGWGNE